MVVLVLYTNLRHQNDLLLRDLGQDAHPAVLKRRGDHR